MDEVKWYENVPLSELKNIIKDNVNAAAKSFVTIGYYLKNIRDRELYLQDEYNSIWEFAQNEFNISKPQASKFMSINDKFSKDGNSPILLDKYKDFSSSKLSEMLYLTDEQLERVAITTTVAEIREIKNPDKVVSTSKQEPERKFCKWDGKSNCVAVCDTGAECCSECEDHGHCNSECGWQDERKSKPTGQCIHRPEFPCTLPEASKLAIGNGENCNAKCCWGCEKHKLCGYECNSSVLRPEVNEQSDTVDDTPTSVNDASNIPERGCSNCNCNDMDPDEYSENCLDEEKEFPCNICDDKLNNWIPKIEDLRTESDNPLSCKFDPEARCLIAIKNSCERSNDDGCMYCSGGLEDDTESDPVETVEADIVQTVPEEPFIDQCETLGLKFNSWLKSNNSSIADIMNDVLKDIKITGEDNVYSKIKNGLISKLISKTEAYYNYLTKELDIKTEQPKPVQPELPILKNNDQRQEWIKKYREWGLWYQDDNINARYYKYDFHDGSRIVVVEYMHKQYVSTGKYENSYGNGQYHLIGGRDEHNPYCHEFYNPYPDNTSSLIEHLKNVQKKG